MVGRVRELFNRSNFADDSDLEKEADLIKAVARKRIYGKKSGVFAVGSNFVGKITDGLERADILQITKKEIGVYASSVKKINPATQYVVNVFKGNVATHYGYEVQDVSSVISSGVTRTDRKIVFGNGEELDGGYSIVTVRTSSLFGNTVVVKDYDYFDFIIPDNDDVVIGYFEYYNGLESLSLDSFATRTKRPIAPSPLISLIPIIYNSTDGVYPDLFVFSKNGIEIIGGIRNLSLFDYSLLSDDADTNIILELNTYQQQYKIVNYQNFVERHRVWCQEQSAKMLNELSQNKVPDVVAYSLLKNTPSSIYVDKAGRWDGVRFEENVEVSGNVTTTFLNVYALDNEGKEVLVVSGKMVAYFELAGRFGQSVFRIDFVDFVIDAIDFASLLYFGYALQDKSVYQGISEDAFLSAIQGDIPIDEFIVNGTYYPTRVRLGDFENRALYPFAEDSLVFSRLDTSNLNTDSLRYIVNATVKPHWFGKGVSDGDTFKLFFINFVGDYGEYGAFPQLADIGNVNQIKLSGFYDVTYSGGEFSVGDFKPLLNDDGEIIESKAFSISSDTAEDLSNMIAVYEGKSSTCFDVATLFKHQRFTPSQRSYFTNKYNQIFIKKYGSNYTNYVNQFFADYGFRPWTVQSFYGKFNQEEADGEFTYLGIYEYCYLQATLQR